MKSLRAKSLVLAVSTALVLLAPRGLPAEETPSGPRLEIEQFVFDAGTVAQGDVVRKSIPIRNSGTETLEIDGYRVSCVCAEATGPERLGPGEAGAIEVTIDTGDLDGAGSTDVRFTTTDTEHPGVNLLVNAMVVNHLIAKPSHLRWQFVQGEPPGTLGVRLHALEQGPLRVLSVETDEPRVELGFRKLEPSERDEGIEGDQWLIETVLPSDAPPGPIAGRIIVTTDHPEQKTKSLKLSGLVQPLVHLSPPSAAFGEIELDGSKKSLYWVKTYGTEPVNVLEAVTDVEGVNASLETVLEGRSYRLRLEFSETLPPGPFAGTLTIRTDSEKVPSLEVPLTGTVVLPETSTL